MLFSGPVREPRDPARPRGLHLSALVRAAMREAGIQAPEWPDDKRTLAMQIGRAWEDWYGPRIDGAIYHPGSLLYGDVWFSPDAIDFDQCIIHEIKTTSRTPRKPSQSPFRRLDWSLQVQGYLWCIGEGEWTRARIHLLYVGQPPAPELEVWEAEFDPCELRRTWKMILEPMKAKAERE